MDILPLAELAASGGLIMYSVMASLICHRLWVRVTELQDKLFEAQQTASRELRDMQAASHAMQAATNTALIAATTAMTAAVEEIRRLR